MAAIDHSAYAPSASPFAGVTTTLSNGLARLTNGVRTRIAYRQTLTSLSTLSPRQLADIGLDGANLETLAFEMAQRHAR